MKVLVGAIIVSAIYFKGGQGLIQAGKRGGWRMATEVNYVGIQHAGVLCGDVETSKKFYIDVLGFKDDTEYRPTKLPYPGAFVRAGAHQLHLMQLPNPDPIDGRPAHGGRDRHVAIVLENIDQLKERLEGNGVGYTASKSGRRALFCRDPDGNALEFMEPSAISEG